MVTTSWLEHFLLNPQLPTPAVQATNAIRFIGDHVTTTGAKLKVLPPFTYAAIGAANPLLASDLILELKARGFVDGREKPSGMTEASNLLNANLTLAGWERYEAEKRGKVTSTYGFMAMKFGDLILDPFVEKTIKPCVKNTIGYDLFDMRDVARAGVIDNIMRAQIRDAAFVLVDLTHDNSGAYWEAGYAEGLGKPVIYICEKTKFNDAKTHFDTNHCTTVLWAQSEEEPFKKELIATLRRSLNLFPTT